MNLPPDDVRLIHLHVDDNVCAVARALSKGETLHFGGKTLCAGQDIAVGHKVAIVDIACGLKVKKYGAVIGSATHDIAAGDWVHTHNLASDYIPTFARGELESGSRAEERS